MSYSVEYDNKLKVLSYLGNSGIHQKLAMTIMNNWYSGKVGVNLVDNYLHMFCRIAIYFHELARI